MCRAAQKFFGQGCSDCQTMYCVRLLMTWAKVHPNQKPNWKTEEQKKYKSWTKNVKPMWALGQVKPKW